MAEKGQRVALPDPMYIADRTTSEKEKCPVVKYLKYGLSVLIVFVVSGGFAFLTAKVIELEHEIGTLKKRDQFNEWNRNAAAKEHEIEKNVNNTLRQLVVEFQRIQARFQKLQETTKTTNTTTVQDIKDHLNVLISTVGNLSATDSGLSSLRSKLNVTENELTKVVANVDDLWEHWNRTNAVVEDLTKLLTKQNETFHFKIAYHSDALYSEVKDVELKQTKFHNYTNRVLNELRSQMNTTRRGFEQKLETDISRVNKSLRRALEHSINSVHASMVQINVKADGMKQELQTSIDNIIQEQSKIKIDFSKTKTEFQENDRKHDSAISDQVSKTESLKDRIAKLESGRLSDSLTIANQKNEIQDLKDRVGKIENGANGLLRTDIRQCIFIVTVAWLTHALIK